MGWVLLEIKGGSFLSPPQQPYSMLLSPPPPPVPSPQSGGFNLNSKVSPSMLLIIIILAIIFFISGLLHLLVRFLMRPPNRDPDEMDNVTALQGQLQQLFHLHDAGVDQSFIDTLPVFNYKAIIGVKDPFDCAVCLCEFEAEDNLRLLPKCSHAFHMDCIDTWLLSHSTCPICRASLLPDFGQNPNCSPVVLVLESGSESSREIVPERETGATVNSQLSDDFRVDEIQEENHKKLGSGEKGEKGEKVVSVKLGKFKNVESEGEGSSDSNADARRCFSMGSFAYVMDETSSLQVPIRTPAKKQSSKKLTPGHRQAMSECGCDSTREFNGFESLNGSGNDAKAIGRSKRESFSWLRGKKERPAMESSRRASSFRFPVHRNSVAQEALKAKIGRRTASEIDMRGWGSGGSEIGVDEEIQRCNSLDWQGNPPSLAKRTLQWLMGKPNKVVHPSFSSNV